MAEPTEGTYIILSVGSQKAMDVAGANDASETNLITYDVNEHDSQIWALTKPEGAGGSWQVICSLTGKCLDVETKTPFKEALVRQYDDDDTNTQRWSIQTDGKNYTYEGTSYPSYKIVPSSATNLAVNSAVQYSYLTLETSSTSDAQRWILIPVSAFTEGGTYHLVPATDVGNCVEIASGSTANLAYAQIGSSSDENNQVFFADVDSESFLVTFINANSNKALDVRGEAVEGAQIVQNQKNSASLSQKFLPEQVGSVVIDGNTVPTYRLKLAAGTGLVLDSAGYSLRLATPSDSYSQRFAFVKTESNGGDLEIPGRLTRTILTRSNAGSITVSQLYFRSTYDKFQARYKIRRYGINQLSYIDSEWMNVANHSTTRSGWGDAWAPTFTNKPVAGLVTMPFSRSYELTAANQSIDLIFEVRPFVDSYGSGFKAHGPVQQSTLTLVISPSLQLDKVQLTPDTTNDSLNFTTTFSMLGGLSCKYLSGRWYGEDGEPFTETVSDAGTSMRITYSAWNGNLYRLPKEGERISLGYHGITSKNENISGTFYTYFSYGGSAFTPKATESTDGSASLVISSPSHSMDYCFIVVPYLDRTRLVSCPRIASTDASMKHWKVLPALNYETQIVVIGGTSSSWGIGQLSYTMESHLFIWNWSRPELSSTPDDPYNDFAVVLVNTDNPPNQTRHFAASNTFEAIAGRLHQVGFSSMTIDGDLSVEGVAIDQNAKYIGGDLPAHGSVQHIQKLVRLSGYGIHPIYRTPYGDWYQTAIEEVDVSKSEMQKSAVSVTQRIVED